MTAELQKADASQALALQQETAAGLRKLLEAKDCFVRAEIEGANAPKAGDL